MPYLTTLSQDQQTEEARVSLPAGRPFTIGRSTAASLRIRDPKLSRVHCQILISSGTALLTDLGSTNGTHVNSRRVTSAELQDGDLVQAGYTRFRYHAGKPAEERSEVRGQGSVSSRQSTGSSKQSVASSVPSEPAASVPSPSQGEGRVSVPPPPPSVPAAQREAPPRPAAVPPPAPESPPLSRPSAPPPLPVTPPPGEAASPEPVTREILPPAGPSPGDIVAALDIVPDHAPPAVKKGSALCASCRQIIPAREIKTGAATNIHGQACCPRCIQSDPLLGRTLAGYRLDAKLGSGSWAVTYKAEQLSMARPVIFRVIRPETAADPELVTQFLAAVKRGGQISHPNLIRIYDIGRTENLCYASMEYIDGESLRQRLAGGTPLPIATAVQILAEIVGAVDIAHRRGVIHRDIRPSNILINDEGVPKLIGLGLAKSVEDAAAGGALRVRHTADLVLYWAPECLLRPAEAGNAADIYSLGVVAYTMFTGEAPFPVTDPVELVRAICEDRPEPLDSIRKDIPRRLSAAVAKAMAKNPADRYPDCQQFIEALRSAAPL